MKKFAVTIKSRTPILHGKKDPRSEAVPRSGPERDAWYDNQWRYTHYANSDGRLGQPSLIIKTVTVRGLRETAISGDSKAGKGKTEQMARACLRIDPVFPLFNHGGIQVPDNPSTLGPAEALQLNSDEPQVFVLKRLCSRGVEVTNLGLSGAVLEFVVLDNSDGYFNPEWLRRGLEYGFGLVGMGTWRPDFGQFEVVQFDEVT